MCCTSQVRSLSFCVHQVLYEGKQIHSKFAFLLNSDFFLYTLPSKQTLFHLFQSHHLWKKVSRCNPDLRGDLSLVAVVSLRQNYQGFLTPSHIKHNSQTCKRRLFMIYHKMWLGTKYSNSLGNRLFFK